MAMSMWNYKEAKNQFFGILDNTSLWDRADFVTWLERKLAEYKLSGQIVGKMGGEGDDTRERFLNLVSSVDGKHIPRFFIWLDTKLAQCRVQGDFQPDGDDPMDQEQYPQWLQSSLRCTPPSTLRGFYLSTRPPPQTSRPKAPASSQIWTEQLQATQSMVGNDMNEMTAHMGGASYEPATFQPQGNARVVMYKKASDNVTIVLMQLADGTWMKGNLKRDAEVCPARPRKPVRVSVTTEGPRQRSVGVKGGDNPQDEAEKEKKRLYARMHRLKIAQDPERNRAHLEKKRINTQKRWAMIKADPEKLQAYLQQKGEYKKVWRARRRLMKAKANADTASTSVS